MAVRSLADAAEAVNDLARDDGGHMGGPLRQRGPQLLQKGVASLEQRADAGVRQVHGPARRGLEADAAQLRQQVIA